MKIVFGMNKVSRNWAMALKKLRSECPKDKEYDDWIYKTYTIKLQTESMTGYLSGLEIDDEMATLITLKYSI